MNLFNFKINVNVEENTTDLILTEHNNSVDSHNYILLFPEYLNSASKENANIINISRKQIWIGLEICNLINITKKAFTFIYIIKKFEQICKQAHKLKV